MLSVIDAQKGPRACYFFGLQSACYGSPPLMKS
jgi:hypothetical protein